MSTGDWLGFGGWFCCPGSLNVELDGVPARYVLQQTELPNWSKFGSLWQSDGGKPPTITLRFAASRSSEVATWDVLAGRVEHDYLVEARSELLSNMWRFAPEANFYDPDSPGKVDVRDRDLSQEAKVAEIYLKTCNRCGRLLPVNLHDERFQLSFSNHCVASHLRPCNHSGFGRINDVTNDRVLQLEYGFQLECRFCKKFEVNAAHNPQRTAAQMKEDAARRRAFELLLEHLYEGTPQLRYRAETGRELADDIWERFGGRCFKCGTVLSTARDMALDHTRPLALLWPLDGSATALCPTHNSEKRDRPPVEFYSEHELRRLSEVTGVPLEQLKDPSPNREAIESLGQQLDWFFNVFLKSPELTKTRDGKRTADLVIKALRKALSTYPGGPPYDLKKPRRR